MDTGQVTFHKNNMVKKIFIKEKRNDIVNRLNKTKEEKNTDFAGERIARDREAKYEARQYEKKKKEEDLEKARRKKEKEELKSYKSIFKDTSMTTNKECNLEDDFM